MILLLRFLAWMLYPLSLCLVLLLVGLGLLWFSRRQTLGKAVATVGALLLVVVSWGPFGRMLLAPLETAHPPLVNPERMVGDGGGGVQWVVVLGAGYRPDAELPATAQLTSTSLIRLAEGVRIHKKLAGSKLLVLVGQESEGENRTRTVSELGNAFGVARTKLVVKEGARNTAEEAQVIAEVVGDDRFVLVTSASHMPRALRLCQDRGLAPVPAPTDYQTVKGEFATLADLPGASNLAKCEAGFYEALASAWRALGG